MTNVKFNGLTMSSIKMNGQALDAVNIDGDVVWSGLFEFSLIGTNYYSVRAKDNVEMPHTLVVPSSYRGKQVTRIGEKAFKNHTEIKEVIVPSTVSRIGTGAFQGCSNIEKMTLPFVGGRWDVNSGINDNYFGIIFGKSGSLIPHLGQNDVVPKTLKTVIVTGTSYQYRLYASFYGLNSLKNVYLLGNNLTEIGDNCFRGCTNLTNIILPKNLKRIGWMAFNITSTLGESPLKKVFCLGDKTYDTNKFETLSKSTLKKATKYSYSEAHPGETSADSSWYLFNNEPYTWSTRYMHHYYFTPDGLGHWSMKPDEYYRELDIFTDEVLPSSVNGLKSTIIEDDAFACFNSLTKITLSNQTSIGASAFWNCINLDSVSLSSTLTSIGDYAFLGCTDLSYIEIPPNVTTIGRGAFEDCTGLTIYPSVSSKPDGWANNWCGNCKVVWYGETEEYHEEYLDYKLLANGTYSVSLKDCDTIPSEIVVPKRYRNRLVTEIGEAAFSNISDLGYSVSINIPSSIRIIHDSAFAESNAIKNITLKANTKLKEIGNYAFKDCTSLTSVTIPDGVASIGECAFSNCTGLASATIGSGVTRIEDDVFYNCTGLVSVTIGSGVTSIGYWAFGKCTNLETVTFIDNGRLNAINECAFYGCESLTSITIPEGVTWISEEAFGYCDSLASVTIPGSIEYIGNSVFKQCTNLSNITISDYYNPDETGLLIFDDTAYYNNEDNWENGVLYIGNCLIDAKKESISGGYGIKEGTIAISPSAFYGCTGLTSITIPNSVTSIGNGAFKKCTNLTSVTFGEKSQLTYIGYYAFDQCSSLMSITLPSNTITVRDWAFRKCSSLKSYKHTATSGGGAKGGISSSSGGSSIGGNTFDQCVMLEDASVPWNLRRLRRAFTDCSDNLIIHCEASSQPDTWDENWNSDGYSVVWSASDGTDNYFTYTLVDTDAYEVKAIDTSVQVANLTIPSTFNNVEVRTIGNYAFSDDQTNISAEFITVTIPDTVICIGNSAFFGCTELTAIDMSNNVEIIAEDAFMDCSNLKNIFIPASTNMIFSRAFSGCDNLTIYCEAESQPDTWDENWNPDNRPVVWGYVNNTEAASYLTFALLSDDTYAVSATNVSSTPAEIVIPSTYNGKAVTSVANSAFFGCASLTNITIPDSVKSIGGYAFYNCYGFDSITFGENSQLTSIGEDAFYNCVSLTSIVVPDSVTSIGDSAFFGCSGLTNITIPDSVESIGSYAFSGCSSLTSIVLGGGITSIGDGAFNLCVNLASITISDGVSSIGENAFALCTSLTIYCEASSQPDTWDENWNPDDRPVVWGTLAAAILGVGKLGIMKLGQRDPNSGSEGLEYTLISGSSSYYTVAGIGTCTDTDIVIPSTYNGMPVASVAENAFLDCTSLTGVTIGNNIASIGCGAFDGCTGLTSITIPDNVIEVLDCAFSNCTGLASATIGSGVTRIEDDVFYNCTGLISIVIPDNVIRIDGGAFGNCTSLTSITIGSGVTYIGDSTFYGCTNLVDVYYNGTTTEWSNISIEADNECLTNATLHTAGYALSITFSSSGHYNVGSGAYSVAPCGSISGTAPETIADGETAKITIAPRQIMGASTTTAAYLDLTVSACTNATYNLVASTSSYSYTLYITPTGAGDISVFITEDTSEDED